MLTRLTLDQLVIPEGRQLRPDEDLTLLAKAIQLDNLKKPILVTAIDQEFILIDGLRRLEATRAVGFATIEAVVTDVLEEACAHLEKEHEGVTLPVRRKWELIRDTRPLVMLRVSLIRRRKIAPGADLARTLLGRALNTLPSEVERTQDAYNKALKAGEEGAEAIRLLEAGRLTVSQVYTQFSKPKPVLQGVTRRPANEEVVLANATRTLNNTIRAAGQMVNGSKDVPKDRLVEIVAEMKKARRSLHRLIKALSEEISE